MQAEGVVAPCDVLETLLDTPVVLGVDDRLLTVVGPRMGTGGGQGRALTRGERKQAAAALALAGEGVREVLTATGDDLYLRGDQLSRDALGQERILAARTVAQLLEAGHEVERDRVAQSDLLLT